MNQERLMKVLLAPLISEKTARVGGSQSPDCFQGCH